MVLRKGEVGHVTIFGGEDIIIDLGGTQVIVSPPSPPTVVIDPPSTPAAVLIPVAGAQGPAGVGTTLSVLAAANLSGHRVVRSQGDGTVVYASSGSSADAASDLYLTTGAIMSGASGDAVALGVVDEPSWTWTPGPVYLSTNGTLTQTPPSLGNGDMFIRQVGSALSPTSLFFNPGAPIVF